MTQRSFDKYHFRLAHYPFVKIISSIKKFEIQFELCTLLTHVAVHECLEAYSCTAGNYMFKVNNRNTITRCEICSKLTIKTREPYFTPCYSVCIVNCEDVIAGWVTYLFYLDSIHKRPYFLKTSLHHNPLCQL